MLFGDAHTTKISSILRMRGRHQTSKPYGHVFMECQPPMPPIERWQRSALEERQAMQVDQRFRYLLVSTVNLAYPIEAPLAHLQSLKLHPIPRGSGIICQVRLSHPAR